MATGPISQGDLARRISALPASKLGALLARLGVGPSVAPAPSTRLVAYCVAPAGAAPSTADLRAFLEDRVPRHMLPDSFVFLPTLPHGPTGKVDRRALTDGMGSESHDREDDDFALPTNPAEQRLAEIWSEVLGQDPIGIHDNFFEIGGHSLLAVRMLGKIRDAFEVDVPMDAVFEAPTIVQLAAYLDTVRWALAANSDDRDSDDDLDEEIEL